MAILSEVFDPTATLETFENQMLSEIQKVDERIDTTDGTPMGCIKQMFNVSVETVREMSLAMYADQSPYTASLPQLINVFGPLYGTLYHAGSPTTQIIEVVVSAACNIYAETTTEHAQFQIMDTNNNIYIPTADVSFSGAGSYSVLFQSKEYNTISSEINTINTIITTTIGIESVNNPTTYASLGSAIETEDHYRKRILKASRFYKTKGTAKILETALINLGCDDAFVFKNLGTTAYREVPAGCIAVIVKGMDTTTERESIATVLLEQIQSAKMYGFGDVSNPSIAGTTINITRTMTMQEERYLATLTWNQATVCQVYLKFNYYSSIGLSETEITTLKSNIVSYCQEANLFRIGVGFNSMDVMSCIQSSLKDQELTGYADNIQFIREDDYRDGYENTPVICDMSFVDVAWGLGTWVAIGFKNSQYYVYSSSDGINWYQTSFTTTAYQLTSVIYEGSTFIIACNNNTIWTSINGLSWTQISGFVLSNVTKMAYIDETYFAINGTNNYATSSDGYTWTAKTFPNSFVAGDIGGLGESVIVTSATDSDTYLLSTDKGANWATDTFEESGQFILSYGNDTTLCAILKGSTTLYKTTNCTTWTTITLPQTITDGKIVSNGTKWIISDTGTYAYLSSADATTWLDNSIGYNTKGLGSNGNDFVITMLNGTSGALLEPTAWVSNLTCQHIYEYLNISTANITITNIIQ